MEGDNWSRRVLATALMASAAVTSVECFSAAVPNVAKVGQHSAERSRQWCSASGTANSRSRCPLPFNDRNLVRTVMDASAPPGGEDYDKDRPMRTSSPIGSRSQRMARSFLDEIESGVGASESSFASRSAANEEAGGARENKEPTSRYGRGNASPEAADAAGADKVAERGRQGGPRGQGVPGVGREAADEKALLADGDSNDAELVRDGRASAAAGGLKSTSSKEEGQEVTEGGGVLGAAKGRVAEQGVGVARDTEGGEGGEGGGGGGGGGGEGEGGEAVQYIPEGGRDARRGGRAEVVEAPTLGGSVGGKQLSGENVPPLGRAAEKEEAARGARPGKKWEVLRKGDEAWGKAGDGHRSSRQRSGSVDDWRGEEDEVGRDDDTAWVSAVRRAGGGGKVQGYGGSRTTGGGASVGGWAAGGEAMEQGEVVASSQGAGGVGQGMAAADWQHRRGQRGQRGQPSEWMKRERSRVKPVGEMELREIARGMGGDAAGRMVEALVVAAIGEMKIPENNGRGPTGRQGWERERRGLNARRGGQ